MMQAERSFPPKDLPNDDILAARAATRSQTRYPDHYPYHPDAAAPHYAKIERSLKTLDTFRDD